MISLENGDKGRIYAKGSKFGKVGGGIYLMQRVWIYRPEALRQ